MIDPALLRSGRLEKNIVIPPPDTDALVGILRHHPTDVLDAIVASAPAQITQGGGTKRPNPVIPDVAGDRDDTDKPDPRRSGS